MSRRSIISLSAIVALGFALLPGNASPNKNHLKNNLLELGPLVSAEAVGADGVKHRWWQASDVKGLMILSDSGRASFQVIADYPKIASKDRLRDDAGRNEGRGTGCAVLFRHLHSQ